jgi:hypothetical protein
VVIAMAFTTRALDAEEVIAMVIISMQQFQ